MEITLEQRRNQFLLTPQEVAEMLHVSVRTVWRLVAAHVINAPVKVGKSARFFKNEVELYLEELKNKRQN